MTKQKKKEKVRLWKESQRSDCLLTKEEAASLLEFLEEQMDKSACDHTLRSTRLWLEKNISEEMTESVIQEITTMGGYCDCEVLMNCYEDYFD